MYKTIGESIVFEDTTLQQQKNPGWRVMVFQQPEQENEELMIPTAKKQGGHADDCQQ